MELRRILVDTNVFEDILTGRKGAEASAEVVNLLRVDPSYEGWVSSATPLILYFLRRNRGMAEHQARARVHEIPDGFSVIPIRRAVLDQAL